MSFILSAKSVSDNTLPCGTPFWIIVNRVCIFNSPANENLAFGKGKVMRRSRHGNGGRMNVRLNGVASGS